MREQLQHVARIIGEGCRARMVAPHCFLFFLSFFLLSSRLLSFFLISFFLCLSFFLARVMFPGVRPEGELGADG